MADRILTPEMRSRIDQCQGMVRSIATKLCSRLPASVNYDDLVSYGQLGLVQAAHSFDPSHRVAFQTFAYYRIRGAICDGLSQMSWASRSVRQRLKAEQLSASLMEQQLHARMGSDGKQASLAADAEWLVQSVEHLTMVHLLADSGDPDSSLAEQFPDDGPGPEELATQNELCDRLKKLIAGLPEIEQRLIQLTYYEGLSITEACEQIGHNKSWGSRTHARILERFGRCLSADPAAGPATGTSA